jgi:hypothetical protein
MNFDTYTEHLADSAPCSSRFDGFDRGDLGTSHEDEMTAYAQADWEDEQRAGVSL